jgi:hypothetical protein
MESISNASCNLGLMVFFFETFGVKYVAPTQNSKKAEESLTAFVSAMMELSDILEALDMSSQNPMAPLPLAFEEIARSCADNIGNMRREIRKPQFQVLDFKLRILQEEVVEAMTSVFMSYIKLLRPYAELLIGYVCYLTCT